MSSNERIFEKFWPEGIPKKIDIPKIPLDAILKKTAEKFPNNPAITYFGMHLSYKVLNELVDIIATKLTELGVKKGETVALHFTNCPPAIACYYAVLRIGARVTMLSPLFQSLEVKYQLNDSEAKILIAWEGFDEIDLKVLPETKVKTFIYSSLGNWISEDPRTGPINSEDGSKMVLEDFIIKTKPNLPKVKINPEEDIACLQYTGGTTGLPKGAVLTHYNLVANVEQCLSVFPKPNFGKEVMMVALPLYHIYAQTVAMNFGIRLGANMIMIFNPRETEELIELIEHNKVTLFPGVAALYNLINNYAEIEKHDLHCIRYCLSGAGPLPLEIQTKFEKLTGSKLREGFGLTEASPITHVNPLEGRYKLGSVGFPVPNTEMKIVDIETRKKILPINEVGELCIKGPQIMKGYYNKPQENANTIREGWLHTGDLALMDEEGYTVIKDRLKNMIKYKGHSVYPAEVEALLLENPKIFECAIIGVPDKDVGENIKGFIVLKPEFKGKVTAKELTEWAKANMSSSKYPRIIEFLDEIPKSAVGKTLHRELRK
jgi:long-chain acyl-CoA synthetase